MVKITVDDAGANSRLDKYIMRMLPGMSRGLMYKQLRKKNITLNGHRAEGSEIIRPGDELCFYLADDTYRKFSMPEGSQAISLKQYIDIYKAHKDDVRIVYENEHLLIMDKPAGMLSQKSSAEDISLNEWMLGYLADTGSLTYESITRFKPSVLNRLDRNTSGLVLGAKTYKCANILSRALKERTLHKYYKTRVWGRYDAEERIYKAVLRKDVSTNTVKIMTNSVNYTNIDDNDIIRTGVRLTGVKDTGLKTDAGAAVFQSDLEIELITGKSHQIRAHLAALGYPIAGDPKYGDHALDRLMYGNKPHSQMLHAYKVVFSDEICRELNIECNELICDADM